jgi:hypothetical protein
VYLVKIDKDGDTLWTRTCGGAGNDYGYRVRQTPADSGYITIGNTYSFGAGNSDMYLVRTDAGGDTLWTETFGGVSVEYGYSVQCTSPEAGFIIAGSTRSFGEGSFDAYIVKTDLQGQPVWTRTCGGELYDDGYSVCQTSPDSGYVIAGSTRSFGAGLYDAYVIKTEPVLAGVDAEAAGITEVMISACGPNPFKDNTVIRYRISRRSRVTIAIHNVLGRRVDTLLDSMLRPGAHSVAWDGRDSAGRALSPGIYFCTLRAEGRLVTRKIVLIR